MKRIILTILIAVLSLLGYSQSNYGFEKWTTQFSHEDPQVWATANRDQSRDVILASRSLDALDGTYSIRIESKLYEGDSVLGYAVLGDVGDQGPVGGIPVSTAADSLIFWVKYKVMPGDTALAFIATRNNGSITGMNQIGWVGESNIWERKSIKVSPAAMDSIVIGIAASDGLKDIAFPGSWMQIDKVVLKDINGQQIPIPNHSFEDWDSFNYTNPDEWFTDNKKLGTAANVTQSTNSYEGSYSARMETIIYNNDTLRGYLSNAKFSNGEHGKVPLIYTPGTSFDSVELFYQYAPVLADTAEVRVELHSNGNRIAEANYWITESTSQYQKLTIPFSYSDSISPDSIKILFSSGRQIGSVLWVDAFHLESHSTELREVTKDAFAFYPNPAMDNIIIETVQNGLEHKYKLINSVGICVQNGTFQSKDKISIASLPKGIYFLKTNINGIQDAQKIIIN